MQGNCSFSRSIPRANHQPCMQYMSMLSIKRKLTWSYFYSSCSDTDVIVISLYNSLPIWTIPGLALVDDWWNGLRRLSCHGEIISPRIIITELYIVMLLGSLFWKKVISVYPLNNYSHTSRTIAPAWWIGRWVDGWMDGRVDVWADRYRYFSCNGYDNGRQSSPIFDCSRCSWNNWLLRARKWLITTGRTRTRNLWYITSVSAIHGFGLRFRRYTNNST